VVEPPICVIPLQVVPVDEVLDALPDYLRVWLEPVAELASRLCDECDVLQILATLHDANDRGVNHVVPLRKNMGRQLYYAASARGTARGAAHRDELDSVPQLGALEAWVELKHVVGFDLLALADLDEDASHRSGQRQQVTLTLIVRNARRIKDLPVCQRGLFDAVVLAQHG